MKAGKQILFQQAKHKAAPDSDWEETTSLASWQGTKWSVEVEAAKWIADETLVIITNTICIDGETITEREILPTSTPNYKAIRKAIEKYDYLVTYVMVNYEAKAASNA